MMKKLAVAIAIAGIATTASVALAGKDARTGINGSLHDINLASGNYTHDVWERTCVFCHTPHNAQTADTAVPLWNHKLTSNPVMTPYAWVSPANASISFDSDPLVGPSRLCMACHDGSTAVDSHGTAGSYPTGTKGMAASATGSYVDALGNTATRFITDLTVTHPIGFAWQDAVDRRNSGIAQEIALPTDGYIDDLENVQGNFDTHNRTVKTTKKTIGDTLYNGMMTCATCHDVHNSVNARHDAGHDYNYFLYAKEEGSAICLSCHYK